MGNNVYETPRNKSKWHTSNDKNHSNSTTFQAVDDKKARMQKLREMAQKQKAKND